MIRKSIRRVLAHKYLGRMACGLLRATHTSEVVPEYLRHLMPERGVCNVRLPDGRSIRFDCPGPQERVAIRLFWRGFGGYEAETTSLFYGFARSGACVVDVGAYTGYYSILAAAANAENRVVAFEPLPANFEQLLGNVRQNRLGNVRAEPLTVGEEKGETELFVPEGELPPSASTLAGFRKAASVIRVGTTSLDDYAETRDLGSVDLVKIDTEGTEHRVLAGMRRIMERDAPLIFCEVLYERNEREIQAVLSELGYRWMWITDRGLTPMDDIRGDSEYRFRNYLFMHPRRADRLETLPERVRRFVCMSQ